MKKKYTKISGIKIAYKGEINWNYRIKILGMIMAGIVSDVLPNGGWWIKAKEL